MDKYQNACRKSIRQWSKEFFRKGIPDEIVREYKIGLAVCKAAAEMATTLKSLRSRKRRIGRRYRYKIKTNSVKKAEPRIARPVEVEIEGKE
jgi:hypothetical protein